MHAHRTFGALFLAFIFFFASANAGITFCSIKKLIGGVDSFSEFTAEVATNYAKETAYRTDFVNLNGLAARIAQRRVLNNVVKLNNGALKTLLSYVPVTDHAEATVALAQYLNERGIKFAFVQAPDKIDPENTLLPEGLNDSSNRIADEFDAYLSENGVSVVDLRTLYDYGDGFFESFNKTDHHWTPKGAFTAFVRITEYLEETFPNESFDETCLDLDHYVVAKHDNGFLGSSGKRTGIYFAGVDDFELIYPDFPTDITTIIDKYKTARRGDFLAANIRQDIVNEGKDYFKVNTYAGYIGGDYPLVFHYNHLTDNGLKIAILKDSYTLPVQSFLSTVCEQIMVVDLRHYTECEAVDLLTEYKPDVVLMMYSPPMLINDKMFVWGDTTPAEINENLLLNSDVEISGNETLILYPCERADLDGAEITLSFDYTGTPILLADATVVLQGTISDGGAYTWEARVAETNVEFLEEESMRCYFTVTLPTALASLDSITFAAGGGVIIDPKMEYGARATAWCAAEEYLGYGENLIFDQYDSASIVIEPGNNDNCITLADTLEPGISYRFTASSIDVLSGKTNGISILLYDPESKGTVRQWTFDAETAKAGAEWTFTVPEDANELSLAIYPGMIGRAKGCSIAIEDAQLIALSGT
jgi:hypothetical protein